MVYLLFYLLSCFALTMPKMTRPKMARIIRAATIRMIRCWTTLKKKTMIHKYICIDMTVSNLLEMRLIIRPPFDMSSLVSLNYNIKK